MFPACTNAAGQATNTVPDVCKIPPYATPTPFPNIGMMPQATGFSTKVSFASRPVLHVMSQIPMSTGDNGGVAGGVASNTVMATVQFAHGSSKVLVEGMQCEMLTAMTKHNQMNTVGNVAIPSQDKVLVAP